MYKDVEPFTSYPIFIHATQNKPLEYFKSAERKVTVSHWDEIHVNEKFHLVNQIAELEGEFGRIDFRPWE